jgi:hypothetical protein
MPIFAKDTQLGHVYTSQTGVDYMIQEIHPERVVVTKISTGEIKDDVDPMYAFVSERQLVDAAKDLEPQNTEQNIPAVEAKPGAGPDENRDPAELSQANAAVEPGGVIKDHNSLHPVRRPVPIQRRPVSTAPAQAPAPVAPAPAKPVAPVARPAVASAPKPAAPRPAVAKAVAKAGDAEKTLPELEAEKAQLLEIRGQADVRLKEIKKLKAEQKAKNDPNCFGFANIDSDPELIRSLREEGVVVDDLRKKIGQRTFDLFFAKGLRMVKAGEWAELNIAGGKLRVKKTK